jgi:hypothetical protein
MSLQHTEAQSAANAKAPRVSLTDIEDAISAIYYMTGDRLVVTEKEREEDGSRLALLTVCFVVMRNGFIVIGHSAPASPENFNAELGRKFAYENAIRQLWPLMGFALRERLSAVL